MENSVIRTTLKENIARTLGVESYDALVRFSDDQRRGIVLNARKKIKFKHIVPPKVISTGNPYVMLRRKIDSKGKFL